MLADGVNNSSKVMDPQMPDSSMDPQMDLMRSSPSSARRFCSVSGLQEESKCISYSDICMGRVVQKLNVEYLWATRRIVAGDDRSKRTL